MSTVLFEPAEAVAAGLCVTARTVADGVTDRHPRRCRWCVHPVPELRAMVAGFNSWAGWKERTRTYARYDVQRFNELSPSEQRILVLAAQDLEPLEPSVPDNLVAFPAAAVDEDAPWQL